MTNDWQKGTLIESFKIAKDIKTLRFAVKNSKSHIPGQYCTIRLVNSHQIVEREYSLANSPHEKGIWEFGVQKVPNGILSNYLHEMKKGEKIVISLPRGIFFNWEGKKGVRTIFIAGGAGIVPFMSIIRSKPTQPTILLGSFRTSGDIAYFDELKKLENYLPNFKANYTLTREKEKTWRGLTGRINEKILDSLGIKKSDQIFICGRTSFVVDIKEKLLKTKIANEQIKTEWFG